MFNVKKSSLKFQTAEQLADQEVRKEIKLTFVGDRSVGKTCLLVTHNNLRHGPAHSLFPTHPDLVPETSFRSLVRLIEEEDGQFYDYSVIAQDTKGDSDYDRNRPLLYSSTDVFVICYSISNAVSFNNVQARWHPEVRLHCPSTPILLVGTKTDLADVKEIDWTEGNEMGRAIEAMGFVECSALADHNVNFVFHEAVGIAVKIRRDRMKKQTKRNVHQSQMRKKCSLL